MLHRIMLVGKRKYICVFKVEIPIILPYYWHKIIKKETDKDRMNWFINQKYRLSLPIAKDKHLPDSELFDVHLSRFCDSFSL